jgi:biotin carboxyl carrier protein
LNFSYNFLRDKHCNDVTENKDLYSEVIDRKKTLLLRPLALLCEQPHYLSGWLSLNQHHFSIENSRIVWHKNPIEVLSELYHFLHMDYVAGKPAANMIWKHDNELLQQAVDFYNVLKDRFNVSDYSDIERVIKAQSYDGFSVTQWNDVQSAHLGFQLGTEILSLLPYIAYESDFFALKVNRDLSITIPEALTDQQLQQKMAKVLAPPPTAKSDEILAHSGGMFYSREAPDREPFVVEGAHFNEGDPLYIVEVMKMFNKVFAPFSGTINQVLVDSDGLIIKKGQPLFKIIPDEMLGLQSPSDIKARQRKQSSAFLQWIK